MSKLVTNRRQFVEIALGGLWVCGLRRGWAADLLPPSPAGQRAAGHGFAVPPYAAKPWVYWMWLNGHITRDGITADLEAMKGVGISGALIMNLGYDRSGPVDFMSAEWQAMFRHAVAEAARLGLTIDMNNDDGWNCGGPAITPANAMQKVVWTEANVAGPGKLTVSLPQPAATWNYYQDICTLAFRGAAGEPDYSAKVTPRTTSGPKGSPCIGLEFAEPYAAQAIVVSRSKKGTRPATCELQASDNGREFRSVCRFETGWHYPAFLSSYRAITVGFPPVRGRFFRLLAPGTAWDSQKDPGFSFRLLGESRVSYWELKAGFIQIGGYGASIPYFEGKREVTKSSPPASSSIHSNQVIDLSSRLDSTGRLEWTAPPGAWTLLRIGYTPTGQLNAATTPAGRGPDCDKLSPQGAQTQFQAFLGKLISETGSSGGKSFAFGHSDSWEARCQNWTGDFRKQFLKRRGYDLLPYLPVLAGGRVVDSVDRSERFLWDIRRTLADLIAECFWGALWKECKAHSLKFTEEASGRGQFLHDPIHYLSNGDIPMGEFWMGEMLPRPDCKLTASTAHVYGKPLTGAEAFTSTKGTSPTSGEWKQHPFSLKAKGDIAFCTGINHLTFHRYVLQPWLKRKPGLTWKGVGTSFERTQTWWKQGAAWIEYLSRCQEMLQRGRFAADVCVFTGESVPNILFRPAKDRKWLSREDASTATEIALDGSGLLPMLPPPEYDFDGCDMETLSRMSVKDGRMVLPDGMCYRLLTLPPSAQMTPNALRKIAALVAAGAVVMGPKPGSAPGLSDFPACDEQVRQLADQVWGPCDGKQIKEHAFGKGRVIWGKPIAEVLLALKVAPDFEYKSTKKNAYLDFIHRMDGGAEIYFVSNQRKRFEDAECTFRVDGRVPELWDPATGRTTTCAIYEQTQGRTIVPLRFDPCGSVFVVFREADRGESIVALRRDGKRFPRFYGLGERFQGIEAERTKDGRVAITAAIPGRYRLQKSHGGILSIEVPPLPEPVRLRGPWKASFPPALGAPLEAEFEDLMSWTKHSDDGVRFFSGTAIYRKALDVPAAMISRNHAVYLDLGAVREIAEVRLNGRRLGILWKPPFRIDISSAVHPGKNQLEVEVTNLWPNRLIGDARLPEKQRIAWISSNPFTARSPLLDSGLLGPVVVRAASKRLYRF